ncbi:MAG: serine/threonine-protein phosphatase [Chloroflexi bacterium]|nr:serine/threonine-protein phosphatase [Chloroflexota bacterium]
MKVEVQAAVAKIKKYAVSESGDTVEIVERPFGGLSLVLADGQRSGRSAKLVSNIVVRKVISLLSEGVRDGAAARAAHDYLRLQRGGKVSADLVILSVDLRTRTLVISRNTRTPVLLAVGDELIRLEEESEPLGVRSSTRPVIREWALSPPMTVLAFSDGLLDAGTRVGQRVPYEELFLRFHRENGRDAHVLADTLLEQALQLDQGRPVDDTSVLVLTVYHVQETDGIRRMHVRFPVPPV